MRRILIILALIMAMTLPSLPALARHDEGAPPNTETYTPVEMAKKHGKGHKKHHRPAPPRRHKPKRHHRKCRCRHCRHYHRHHRSNYGVNVNLPGGNSVTVGNHQSGANINLGNGANINVYHED